MEEGTTTWSAQGPLDCGGRHGTVLANVKWSVVAAAVIRLGKQVRERWYNHLDPTLNKGPWTVEEDAKLVSSKKAGKPLSEIAKLMEGRGDGIKNRWNSAKRRRGGEFDCEGIRHCCPG